MTTTKPQGGAAVNAILSQYAGAPLTFKELLQILRTNGAFAAALRKAVAARPTPTVTAPAPAVLPKAELQPLPAPPAPTAPSPPAQHAPMQWSETGGKFGSGKWG